MTESVQNMHVEHRSAVISTRPAQAVSVDEHGQQIRAEIERLCSAVHPVYAGLCRQAINGAFAEALPAMMDQLKTPYQSTSGARTCVEERIKGDGEGETLVREIGRVVDAPSHLSDIRGFSKSRVSAGYDYRQYKYSYLPFVGVANA